VCRSETAVFTVTATGFGTLGYQWQKNGTTLSSEGHYSGTSSPVLTIAGTDGEDVATYRCVVSDSCGNLALSRSAALALNLPTLVTQQPLSQRGRLSGSVKFAVTAAGSGTLSYQWQKDGTNLTDDGHYSGTTSPTLTVSNVSATDSDTYRCVVRGNCGFGTSNPATLTLEGAINHPPSGISATVTTLEDSTYRFATAEFGFTDPNDRPPNSLLAVKVVTLPVAGTLKVNGIAFSAGRIVNVADIVAGRLSFTPAANSSGPGYASFTFQVRDDGGTDNGGVSTDPLPKTMTINVTSVNDAPVGRLGDGDDFGGRSLHICAHGFWVHRSERHPRKQVPGGEKSRRGPWLAS